MFAATPVITEECVYLHEKIVLGRELFGVETT